MSEKLSNNSDYYKAYMIGHEFILEKRFALAKAILPVNKMPDYIIKVLTNTTIAGSSDILGVKCLHSHLAQELAYGNNPIGADVINLIGMCDDEHNIKNRANKEAKHD